MVPYLHKNANHDIDIMIFMALQFCPFGQNWDQKIIILISWFGVE